MSRSHLPPLSKWSLEADHARQNRGKSAEKLTTMPPPGFGRSRPQGNGRYIPMVGVSACLQGWYVRQQTQVAVALRCRGQGRGIRIEYFARHLFTRQITADGRPALARLRRADEPLDSASLRLRRVRLDALLARECGELGSRDRSGQVKTLHPAAPDRLQSSRSCGSGGFRSPSARLRPSGPFTASWNRRPTMGTPGTAGIFVNTFARFLSET